MRVKVANFLLGHLIKQVALRLAYRARQHPLTAAGGYGVSFLRSLRPPGIGYRSWRLLA